MKMTLRPYQKEAVAAFEEEWDDCLDNEDA
jgi:superfamily II DNA or RNA helicase